jgi:hypothetical protein
VGSLFLVSSSRGPLLSPVMNQDVFTKDSGVSKNLEGETDNKIAPVAYSVVVRVDDLHWLLLYQVSIDPSFLF